MSSQHEMMKNWKKGEEKDIVDIMNEDVLSCI